MAIAARRVLFLLGEEHTLGRVGIVHAIDDLCDLALNSGRRGCSAIVGQGQRSHGTSLLGEDPSKSPTQNE